MGDGGGDGSRGRRSNALLNAYYRTSPRTDGPKAAVDGVEQEPVPDGGKAAAHKYAAELIQTLSLSKLLIRSTQLRKEAREVEAGLHRIVQESYTKFQAAAGVVGEISNCSKEMEGDINTLLETVEAVADRTEKVNSRLAEGRERVEQLEGARRVLQLLRVTRQLPTRMRQLHASGQTSTAAERFELIQPSILRLERIHEPFREARKEIEVVAREIGTDIAKRMSEDDEIDTGVAVKLRVQLGESPALMKAAFLETCETRVMGNAPPCEQGVAHTAEAISFFSESVLPLVVDSGKSFSKMFPDESEVFVPWATQLIDTAISIRARQALKGSTDVDAQSIADLVERTAAAKARAKEQGAATSLEPLARILSSETEAACDGVLSEAHVAIFAHLEKRLSDIVGDVLLGRRSVYTLTSEFQAEIGSATDSATILEKAIGIRDNTLGNEATGLVTVAVMKRLALMLRTSSPETRSRELLLGAQICSIVDSKPGFRKAKPSELCVKLLREYATRKSLEIAEPLRGREYDSVEAVSRTATLLEEMIGEVCELLDDSRNDKVSNGSSHDRRSSRRSNSSQEKDLGSLQISIGATLEMNSTVLVRMVLSCVFKSWIEFLRDVKLRDGAIEQVREETRRIARVTLRSFAGSEEGLDEMTAAVIATAKERTLQ